jgi:hypothetical protein
VYSNLLQAYDNGRATFQNTVTVDAVNKTIGDPEATPGAYAERTFMREVYGYEVGMVYRESTHWVYDPTRAACRNGYSVIMRAVDHN